MGLRKRIKKAVSTVSRSSAMSNPMARRVVKTAGKAAVKRVPGGKAMIVAGKLSRGNSLKSSLKSAYVPKMMTRAMTARI